MPCCFRPSGTPGSSASLMSTWDRSYHLSSPPQGCRGPSCWHRLGLAAWGHKPRSWLGQNNPGQSQGVGKDGPLCAAAWGSNLRAMCGLHCLRSSRAGNGGKGVSRGLAVRASRGVAEQGGRQVPPSPLAAPSSWNLGRLWGSCADICSGFRGFPPSCTPHLLASAVTWGEAGF